MRHLLSSPPSCVFELFCAVLVLAGVAFASNTFDATKCRDSDVGVAIVAEAGVEEAARGDVRNGDPHSFIPLLTEYTRVRRIRCPLAASIPYTLQINALRRPRVFATERISSAARQDLDPASHLA